MLLSLLVFAYKMKSYLFSLGVPACLISRKHLPSGYPPAISELPRDCAQEQVLHVFCPAFHTIGGCFSY